MINRIIIFASILFFSSATLSSFAKTYKAEISQGETLSLEGVLDPSCRGKVRLKIEDKLKLSVIDSISNIYTTVNSIKNAKGAFYYGYRGQLIEPGDYLITLRKRVGNHPSSFPQNCNQEPSKIKLDFFTEKYEENDDPKAKHPVITLNPNTSTTINTYGSILENDSDYYSLNVLEDGFLTINTVNAEDPLFYSARLDDGYSYNSNDYLSAFNFVKNGDHLLKIFKPSPAKTTNLNLRLSPITATINLVPSSLVNLRGFVIPQSESLYFISNGMHSGIDYSLRYKISSKQAGLVYLSANGDFDYLVGLTSHGIVLNSSQKWSTSELDNGDETWLKVIASKSQITNIESFYDVKLEFFPAPKDNEGQSLRSPAVNTINLSIGDTQKITGDFSSAYTATTHDGQQILVRDVDVYKISVKEKCRVSVKLNTDNGFISADIYNTDNLNDYPLSFSNYNKYESNLIQLEAGEYLLDIHGSFDPEAHSYDIELSASKPILDDVSGQVEINLPPKVLRNIDHFASAEKTFIIGQGENLDQAGIINGKKIINLKGNIVGYPSLEGINIDNNKNLYNFNINGVLIKSITDTTQEVKSFHRNYLSEQNKYRRIPSIYANLGSIIELYWNVYEVNASRDDDGKKVSMEIKFGTVTSQHQLNKSLPHGRFKLEIK